MALVITPIIGIPLIKEGDDLSSIIRIGLANSKIDLEDGDILVITQKIVSKSEGRMISLDTITPSQRAKEIAPQAGKDARLVELILRESSEILRTKPGTIIVEHRLGFICANAGIDHSNVDSESESHEEKVMLLPMDPDRTAREIRNRLEAESEKKLGVLIIDSHGRAWRLGTVGTAIGIAGIPGVVDLRGKPDIFGYVLQSTEVGVADELASSASLMMGQSNEGVPAVHIRGFPYELRNASLGEILRPKESDLFR